MSNKEMLEYGGKVNKATKKKIYAKHGDNVNEVKLDNDGAIRVEKTAFKEDVIVITRKGIVRSGKASDVLKKYGRTVKLKLDNKMRNVRRKLRKGNKSTINESVNVKDIVPGRVQSRVNISNKGWDHVIDRHFNLNKNASQFSVTKGELKNILSSKEIVKTPVTRVKYSVDGLRYIREVKMKSYIGFDKFSSWKPTKIMSVVTDKYGNLVTTTPGILK